VYTDVISFILVPAIRSAQLGAAAVGTAVAPNTATTSHDGYRQMPVLHGHSTVHQLALPKIGCAGMTLQDTVPCLLVHS